MPPKKKNANQKRKVPPVSLNDANKRQTKSSRGSSIASKRVEVSAEVVYETEEEDSESSEEEEQVVASPEPRRRGRNATVAKPVAKKSVKKEEDTIPVEISGYRSRSSSRNRRKNVKDDDDDEMDMSSLDDASAISAVSAAGYVNPDSSNNTAIDDEQLIEFQFRTGLIDQWYWTVQMLATSTGPLMFVAVPMFCYFLWAYDNSNKVAASIGTMYLVVYICIVLAGVALGFPAVLLQRIFYSITSGSSASKSSELEIICFVLAVVTCALLWALYHTRATLLG
jgi:hypothetical protein